MPVKHKHIAPTKTSVTADELKFANRFIFKKATIDGQLITEEQWNQYMYDYGRRFASLFAKSFNEGHDAILTMLTSGVVPGCPGKSFWAWWVFKWQQNDYQYISNKVYQQPISYLEYKSPMLHCSQLEQELMNMLSIKAQQF